MKEIYLYTDSHGNEWYEYKGHKYFVTKLPITTIKEQHQIEQKFIDGEVLLEKYFNNKKVVDILNK